MHPHPPTSSPPSTRDGASIRFMVMWIMLHAVLILVLYLSYIFWPILVLVLVPVSYAFLIGSVRPAAWGWGGATCGGGILWMGLFAVLGWHVGNLFVVLVGYGLLLWWPQPLNRSQICWIGAAGILVMSMIWLLAPQDLVMYAVLGFTIGLTTMPLLPRVGHWTGSWPLINMLGYLSAAAVFPWMDPPYIGNTILKVCIISGTLYGVITGPVLAILLDADRPTVRSLTSQDVPPLSDLV